MLRLWLEVKQKGREVSCMQCLEDMQNYEDGRIGYGDGLGESDGTGDPR